MPTPIRGKKQHNSSEKARANPCSDAIITHNQIRADLNRHRTQNHIKGNSMCMALRCAQSLLSCSSLPQSFFDFLTPLLPVLLSICHHHHHHYKGYPPPSNASDLKNLSPLTSLGSSCWLPPTAVPRSGPLPEHQHHARGSSWAHGNSLQTDDVSFLIIPQIYANK